MILQDILLGKGPFSIDSDLSQMLITLGVVTIASLCYRGATGVMIRPIRRFVSTIIIGTVITLLLYHIKEITEFKYIVAFFIGLMSDTITTFITDGKNQNGFIRMALTTIMNHYHIGLPKVEAKETLPKEESKNNVVEAADEVEDEQEKIKRRLAQKRNTTRH